MKQLALITDDLSSATDCGIQVSRSGLFTVVLFGPYTRDFDDPTAEVVSIDTDTRNLPPEQAYRVTRQAAESMVADGFEAVYKSVDSTLRGNLGPEVDAVMDAGRFELAIIAPAFPLYGRTTLGGRHFLNGVPLSRTEFASDPRAPMDEDDLLQLFASKSRRKPGLVPLEILRQGTPAVSRHVASLREKGVELVIFDTSTEEDLDRIIRCAAPVRDPILWVGSTGLARCVPDLLTRPSSRVRKPSIGPVRSALVVAGSASSVTCEQMEVLRGLPGVVAVRMDPCSIVRGGPSEQREISRCVKALEAGTREGKDLALHVASARSDLEATFALGRERGVEKDEASATLAAALAEVAEQLVRGSGVDGLVLTGGDTAKAVCHRLGAVGAELLEEVEPGIPLGRLFGSVGLPIITKAGGFGKRDSLVHALGRLKE